jgi:hypothetical protein
MLAPGVDVIPVPSTTNLPVRPVSRPNQPRIFAETTNFLQNLNENTDTRKTKLSLEDFQAIREVADKANAA